MRTYTQYMKPQSDAVRAQFRAMSNTPFSRILIAIAAMVLLIGSTLSQPVNMAVDQATGGYTADVDGGLADDSPSSGDLFVATLSSLFIPLAATLILEGFSPRPAVRSHAVHYPVLPQGPPTQI